MLISKLGAVAPLTAVRKIVRIVRTNSNPECGGIFVQIAVFCTKFVIPPGIVDFLAFCKFQKPLILNDLTCGKSVRLPAASTNFKSFIIKISAMVLTRELVTEFCLDWPGP